MNYKEYKSYHFLCHLVYVSLEVSLTLKGDDEGLQGLRVRPEAGLLDPAAAREALHVPVGEPHASVAVTAASLAFVAVTIT